MPYMLVVGEREQSEQAVSVRERHGGEDGVFALKEFADRLSGELYSPALKPAKSSERHA